MDEEREICGLPERVDQPSPPAPSRSDGQTTVPTMTKEEFESRCVKVAKGYQEGLNEILYRATPPPFMSNLVPFKFSVQSIHDPVGGF